MVLSTKCKSCNANFEQSFVVVDRIDLAQKHGEEMGMICKVCGADDIYAPDDFKAVNNVKVRQYAFAAAVVLSLISGTLALTFLNQHQFASLLLTYIIFAVPLVIFFIYIKHDTSAIRLFNRVKLKGHNVNAKMQSTRAKVNISKVSQKENIHTKKQQKLPSERKSSN